MDGRVDREDKVIRKLYLILASAGGRAARGQRIGHSPSHTACPPAGVIDAAAAAAAADGGGYDVVEDA